VVRPIGGKARALLVLLAVAVLAVALMWTLQRRLIYLPATAPLPPAAQVLDGARDVRLRTADGLTLTAWHLPPRDGAATVLVAHGNGGDIAGRAPLAAALGARGIGVLLLEYRGYGGNPGSPSEEGLSRDARAARAYLCDDAGVPDDRLLYYGESLGGAVVAELAVEHPPAGLVLRSPFTDLAAVGAEHYPFLPVRALLRDRHEVAGRVRRIDVPTIVVYGSADSIVPPAQSRAVADAAAGPTRVVVVEGADHNDLSLLAGGQLIDAVAELADQVTRR
jgi:fermentation-respiration switch protein FrsA (DUF1100 family)